MAEPSFRSRWRGTAVWLGLLVGLNLLLWAVLVVFVPMQKKRFDEYNLQLPWLTKTVIQASDWFTSGWYFVTPTLVSAMCVGVLAGRHLFRRPTVGTAFAGLCLFALVAALTVTVVGLVLPEVKLAEGRNK